MSDTPRTDVWLIEKYDLSMGPYRSLPQMFMQEALHQHSAPADWRKSYKVAAERIAQLECELAEWKARAEAVEGELAEVSKMYERCKAAHRALANMVPGGVGMESGQLNAAQAAQNAAGHSEGTQQQTHVADVPASQGNQAASRPGAPAVPASGPMLGSDYRAPEQPCFGCGEKLLIENAWMEDGCPCNTPAGVNNHNLYRWRLLHELQQRQSHELEKAKASGPSDEAVRWARNVMADDEAPGYRKHAAREILRLHGGKP